MKKFLNRLGLLLTVVSGHFIASAEVTGIQVSDGNESIIFYLNDRPEVTFTDTDLVVTGGEHKVCYPMTSTITFDFIEGSAVDVLDGEIASFKISDSEIRATGLKSNELVQIFNMSGKLIYSSNADNEGKFMISTDILPKEPLIFHTNKFTYKFISF